MIFSSVFFIFVFLPITLLIYFVIPKWGKNAVLLICSMIFYARHGAGGGAVRGGRDPVPEFPGGAGADTAPRPHVHGRDSLRLRGFKGI